MKLIILNKLPIVGKDKREWVKLSGLSEKGKIVEPFLAKAEYEALKFPEENFLTPADIAELFKNYKTVDVYFDDNKRIDTVE